MMTMRTFLVGVLICASFWESSSSPVAPPYDVQNVSSSYNFFFPVELEINRKLTCHLDGYILECKVHSAKQIILYNTEIIRKSKDFV